MRVLSLNVEQGVLVSKVKELVSRSIERWVGAGLNCIR